MTTVKDIAIDEIRDAIIELKFGISPLSQMNDDYKERREDSMYSAANRALDAIERLRSYIK